MDQRQINRLEMFRAVQNYLDENTNVWSAVPILVTLKNDFDIKVTSIEESAEKQQGSRVFLGKNKTTQKRVVAQKVDVLNDALEAYASLNDDAQLEQKAAKTFSDLYTLRNQDFEVVIKETIVLLEDNVNNLGDYGVTEGQITDLKNAMDNFLLLTGKPRQYRIASKQATANLEELFATAMDLLNKKIDKLMTRFKGSNTNFFNGYRAARVIVDK